MTLWRNLSCSTLPGTWLLASLSRWRATMFLRLRRCTLESDGGVALAAPAGPPAAPGSGDRSPCLPRPLPRSNGEGERPSRGPDGGGVMPARARPPGLPPSNGEGDTRPAPSSGIAVAPGRGRAPGLPFPRSTGDGEPPNEGACVAPGATRPALPRGPGVTAGPRSAPAGLVPGAGTGLPSSRAAARVGGGTFFGFSALIFCSSSALLGTPFQPRSIFGCATFAFTAGGFAVGGCLRELLGSGDQEFVPLHLGERSRLNCGR